MRSPTPRHPEDEAAIDAFVHHVVAVAGRSRDTGDRHRWNLRRFLAWCRDRGLDAHVATATDVAAYLDDYARGRGLSSSAIASVLGTLRPFYDHLCPDRPNPARCVPMPSSEPTPMLPYTPAEATQILELLDADDIGARFNRSVIVTLAGTGIRRSELVGLRTSDLDLAAGLLLVRDGAGEVRSVPLPVETVQELQGYLGEVRPICPSSDRLFANPRTRFDSDGYGRLEPRGAGVIVRRAGRRSGVDGPHTCHRWRVTATVELLRAGVDAQEVGRRLGVRNPRNLARYLRFVPGNTPADAGGTV